MFSWQKILFSSLLSACLLFEAEAFREHSSDAEWQSSQVHGLGGSALLSEELTDQIILNPAAISRRMGKFETQLYNINVSLSKDSVSTAKLLSDVSKSSNSGSNRNAQIAETFSKLQPIFGANLSVSSTLSTFGTRIGGFYLLPYVHVASTGGVDVPSWPEGNVQIDSYGGLAFGFAQEWKKKFALAATLRPGVRTFAEIGADLSSISDFSGSNSSSSSATNASSNPTKVEVFQGVYVPIDLSGAYYFTPNVTGYLGIRNLFDSRPIAKTSKALASNIPMKANLGMTHSAWSKGVQKLRWYADMQDVAGVFEQSGFWFRLTTGGQYLVRLPSRQHTSFGLHAGLRSGYPSVGVNLDLFIVKLEGAYFTRELGTRIGQRPERCYSLRAYSSLTF